jgi:adenine-specific DNA-methyltransferase
MNDAFQTTLDLPCPPAEGEVRRTGAVYTPPMLAAWAAELLARELGAAPARIADLACGDGELLAAVDAIRPARDVLVGIDVDGAALAAAGPRLASARLVERDALVPPGSDDPVTAMRAVCGGPLDGVILNPPWGAALAHSTVALRAAGYELATGQYDSSDLFVELALGSLREGGTAVFILPDSLFQPERAGLRALLAERATLRLIARLGEGLFPEIFRGVAVVVASSGAPDERHEVACLRLRADHRRAVLAGDASLASLERRLVHRVPQARFRSASDRRFDVDVREADRRVLARLERHPRMPWADWLDSGRGVELSKHGRVVRCGECGVAAPAPRRPRPIECSSCGGRSHQPDVVEIVRSLEPGARAARGWAPLIVGEDVERYRSRPSRQIKLRVAGIAYKDRTTYEPRKLLVRKTGVGLSVSIDESGSLTTQVVFHYLRREGSAAPTFLLDYLLGVLNSRVMLAYHLVTNGDLEWRSHPYVTQRVIESLPIPALRPGSPEWRQGEAIAAAVRRRGPDADPSSAADLEVDALVAGLYGLSAADCRWVGSTLRRAGDLRAISTLRVPPGADLRPKLVAR